MLKAVKNNVFRVCNNRWNILELLDVDFPRSTVLFGARFERSVITHLADAVRRLRYKTISRRSILFNPQLGYIAIKALLLRTIVFFFLFIFVSIK